MLIDLLCILLLCGAIGGFRKLGERVSAEDCERIRSLEGAVRQQKAAAKAAKLAARKPSRADREHAEMKRRMGY